MGRSKGFFLFVALLTFSLAGCLGGDDPPGANGDDPINGVDGTGAVEGTILTVDLDPVEGATIALVQDTQLVADTRTDEQGAYAIRGVAPGDYRIQMTAPCCREYVQGVTVPEGETVRVSAQLERFTERDLQTPHMKQFEWTGLLACSFGVLGGISFNCGGFSENDDSRHDFEVEEGLKTIVVAMHWNSANTNLNDGMILDLQRGGTRLAEGIDDSPIEYRVDAGDGGSHDFENIDSTWDLHWLVWAGGDANVIWEQTFTVNWHEYYWEHAPEDASALPDF